MMSHGKSDTLYKRYGELHREQQTAFLNVALREVEMDQSWGVNLEDSINEKVELAKKYKLNVQCLSCGEFVSKHRSKCENCKL